MRERITCFEIPPSWFDNSILPLVSCRFPSPSVDDHTKSSVNTWTHWGLTNFPCSILAIFISFSICVTVFHSLERVQEREGQSRSFRYECDIYCVNCYNRTTITRRRIGEMRTRERISYKCVSVSDVMLRIPLLELRESNVLSVLCVLAAWRHLMPQFLVLSFLMHKAIDVYPPLLKRLHD